MDPKTLQLIIFLEQMAALVAKSIVDLKNVISSGNTQNVDQIIADADATYKAIIEAAKNPPAA